MIYAIIIPDNVCAAREVIWLIREKKVGVNNMIQDNINEQKQGKMNSLKRFLINLFDIRGDMMSYEDIDAMMEENTDIHGSNMWIGAWH